MPTQRMLLATIVSVHVLIQFSGCSLIGLGIGAAVDGGRPDEYVFTASEVDRIKRGSSIEVLREDSSIVSGDFEGRGFLANEEYAVKYKQFTNSLPIGMNMPALGESISIMKHGALGRGTLDGTLLGFDTGVVQVHFPGWNEPAKVLVEAVDTIRYNNSTFLDGDVLRQLMRNGRVPFNSGITITNKDGSQTVQLSEILRIRQPLSNNAKWICLGLGAVVDAVAIISIATMKIGPFNFQIK